MIENLTGLFGSSSFLPHGYCLSWSPALVITYVLSDVLIFLSYFSMPLAIGYFARHRVDFPYRGLLWLFAAFIMACGATHLMGAILLWQPLYALDAILKAITALVSMITAIVLWPLLPHALKLPSPAQLRAANAELQQEIMERRRVEAALQLAKEVAEDRLQKEKMLIIAIVESSEDAIVGKSLDGIVTSWNRAATRIFGYTAEEMIGQPILKLVPEELHAEEVAILDAISHGRPVEQLETRRMRKDGVRIDISVTASPIRDGEGRIIGVSKIARDITERKRSEVELQKLSLAVEQSPVSILITDMNARVEYVNQAFVHASGYTRDEMLGKNPRLLQSGKTPRATYDDLWSTLSSGHSWYGEFSNRHKDGREYVELARISPIRQPDGTISHYLGVAEDISEHRRNVERAQVLLKINELSGTLNEREFLTTGLEFAEKLTGSAIGFLHFINTDQETIELVTWTRGALQGCHAAYDTHYPISKAGIWADCFRQKQPVIFNDYPAFPDKHGLPEGHAHLQRLISIPVIESDCVRMMIGVGNKHYDYDDWDVETVQLIGNDLWRIVRRQHAERALGASEQKFRTIYDSINDAIFVHDPETGGILDINNSACSMYGYSREQLLHLTLADISANEEPYTIVSAVNYVNAARRGERPGFEWLARDSAGKAFWVAVALQSVNIVGEDKVMAVVRNIDARKRAEDALNTALKESRALNHKLTEAQNQLLQSEKLAAIGQLAAGVAHELNNPIGFVSSNLRTLEGYLHDLFAIINAIPAVDVTAADALMVIEKVRSLMRTRDYDFLHGDVPELMRESADGLERVRSIVQDLKGFARVGEAGWQLSDLHQGLDSTLNIVWNELKYKCTLNKEYGDLPPVRCILSQLNQVFMNMLVNASHAIADKGTVTIRTGTQGNEVFVAFVDTGEGIPAENMNRIFDPFFTTKPVGKGTGLGLSLAYSIVKKHHGRIEVASEVGKGTTFTIWLPIEGGQDGGQDIKV